MQKAALTLVLAAALGLFAQWAFYEERLGLNVLTALALLLMVGWRLRWATPRRIDLWMPAFALAFALFIAIRGETAVVAFDLLALLTLAAAWSASLRGVTVSKLPAFRLLREAWDTATGSLWRALPALPVGVRALPLGSLRRHRLLPIVMGIVLALPLLLLFGSLFTSADPVFAKWWDDLIDLAEWDERIREGGQRLVVALVFAWIVIGAISWPTRRDAEAVPGSGPLSSDTATAFLGTIALLFAVFVGFQVAYLFGGGDTVSAVGVGYAEYARRGFFELLAVAAITAAILFLLDLATERRTREYAAAALVLVALTGVLLISSVYRLDLYQREYGWSELRLYALAMIVAVAVALGIIAWAVLKRRMSFAVQPMVFAALTVALIVNAIGPASFILRANVSRLGSVAAEPTAQEHGLDSAYLVSLGEAGVDDLVALRDKLPELERFCVDAQLFWRYHWREPAEPTSWQSWNLDREQARQAVASLQANVWPAFGDPASSADMDRLYMRATPECFRYVGPPRSFRPG